MKTILSILLLSTLTLSACNSNPVEVKEQPEKLIQAEDGLYVPASYYE